MAYYLANAARPGDGTAYRSDRYGVCSQVTISNNSLLKKINF